LNCAGEFESVRGLSAKSYHTRSGTGRKIEMGERMTHRDDMARKIVHSSPMKKLAIGTAKRVVKALAYGTVGALTVLLLVAVMYLNDRPDLKVWHEVRFENEFERSLKLKTFQEYLVLEDRLFEELEREVLDKLEPEDQFDLNRYHRGSLSDPERWPTNWNRTFVWDADKPVAGVLLLHGMSDSPYSLRTIGKAFHDQGATVIGLRIPGHGTAPSGLVTVKWEDMAAAVRLAMAYLLEQVEEAPIYIVGYSNGGALAVEYGLSAMWDKELPEIEGVILVSPAIGVSPMAALAVWQGRLGWFLGLRKLAWSSVLIEYDPFKYNSFAVNAGDQVHRLTGEIRERMRVAENRKDGRPFPRLLALQSAADATVSTKSLVQALFDGNPERNHELVIFGINRMAGVEPLLANDPAAVLGPMLKNTEQPFDLSWVTNENPESRAVEVRSRATGREEVKIEALGKEWPDEVFSLSHVALPFRGDDPLYGGDQPEESPGIQLGNTASRGERGLLRVSGDDVLRLRWNPFYDYLEERVLKFTGFSGKRKD